MAKFVAGFQPADIPAHVRRSVVHHVLDTVGVALAALPLDTSRAASRLAAGWGSQPEVTVLGTPTRLPAPAAAFVNGTLAHSLDFDDTHLPSVLHPSASLVPTMLAVGEAVDASGEMALTAAALGYEICIRTGMAAYDRALGNSVFFERGWHATSICGTLASAAVAARLLGSDAALVQHAVSIAASFCSGLLEANRAGGSVKRLHCGWAAHAGVIAAQAAEIGFTGPPSVFEGRFGLYEAFCGGVFERGELIDGLGERWAVEEIFYKPYPANHFTHGAIDAAFRIRSRVDPRDIEQIELGVPTATLRTIAEPAAVKARPATGYQAQFSGPFVVASALLGSGEGLGLSLDDFAERNVADERYLNLASRVRCYADPECDAIFPNQFPAILRVHTRHGAVLEERVMANRGGPAWPLSETEVRIKFMSNATRVLDSEQAEAIANTILTMDDRPIRDVAAVLRKAAAQWSSTPGLST